MKKSLRQALKTKHAENSALIGYLENKYLPEFLYNNSIFSISPYVSIHNTKLKADC